MEEQAGSAAAAEQAELLHRALFRGVRQQQRWQQEPVVLAASGGGSNIVVRRIDGLDTVDLDDEGAASSSSSGSSSKRVTFSRDTVDNESNRLQYDRVPMATRQHHRKPTEVAIDVGRLESDGHQAYNHWETYYGARGKFAGAELERVTDIVPSREAGNGNGGRGNNNNHNRRKESASDYMAIFTSPYFDYRRTHSGVSLRSATHYFISL